VHQQGVLFAGPAVPLLWGRVVICARCDRAILREEKAVKVDKFSTSGAGIIGHVHERCPRPGPYGDPIPEAPSSPRR